jgi:hypothetical protein
VSLQRSARVPLVTRVTLPASARRQLYSEEPAADLFEPVVALFGLGLEPGLSPPSRANYMPT